MSLQLQHGKYADLLQKTLANLRPQPKSATLWNANGDKLLGYFGAYNVDKMASITMVMQGFSDTLARELLQNVPRQFVFGSDEAWILTIIDDDLSLTTHFESVPSWDDLHRQLNVAVKELQHHIKSG
jgi:hypothetical protein